MTNKEMARRFDRYVSDTLKRERKFIEERWRTTPDAGEGGDLAEHDNHDEWRKLNNEKH